MPQFEINFLAVGVAAIAHFVLGFLWYTPLFGRVWAKEMGFNADVKPPASLLARGMILGLVGNLLMAWVLSSNLGAWNPESWGQGPSQFSPTASAGMAALFTWLGFFLPVDLNTVAWEGRSWKGFAINTGYHFLSLLIVALILTSM